jgi:hypothetical protein
MIGLVSVPFVLNFERTGLQLRGSRSLVLYRAAQDDIWMGAQRAAAGL